MSLLSEAWMPVLCRDGSRKWISPEQISDPAIVAFDANRPDFGGALMQFMIGLLQTTAKITSRKQWRKYFNEAPDFATLSSWFEPYREAFVFDGDGARFMQDYSLPFNAKDAIEIDGLLIEAPGDKTIKDNTDHFIKRGQVNAMCPHCAVTALLTLQINAPAGGVGHRTGLRGGGPLTTLVVTEKRESLWQDIWLNVCESNSFLERSGDKNKADLHFIFPWLADIRVSQAEGGSMTPIQVHPAHVFWAMPRRIRIDFDHPVSGECDICGRTSEQLVRSYVTKNYGLNYKGAWDHPLSPYYESKDEWLPVHPQPGGLGYRYWLGWTSNFQEKRRCAHVVTHVLNQRQEYAGSQLRLRAFGFDMDNMKARCWYESTFPLYSLDEHTSDERKYIGGVVARWLDGANQAASFLRNAVKDAWFGADSRGDFSMIDASFWAGTEAAFYRFLKQLIHNVREVDAREAVRFTLGENWRLTLKNQALYLFDGVFAGAGEVARQHPRRIAQAHKFLRINLEGKKFYQSLELPLPEKGPGKVG